MTINLAEFRNYAKEFNVIPVWKKYFADNETPVTLYRKLAKNKTGTFLLESAEHGGVWAQYSFIGISSQATLTEENGSALWKGNMPAVAPIDGDPLKALEKAAKFLRSPRIKNLPPLTGGLVGYLSYDAIRNLEKVPSLAKDDLKIPLMSFMLTTNIAIYDHYEGSITLIANAINWDGKDSGIEAAFETANKSLLEMEKDLFSDSPALINEFPTASSPTYTRMTTDKEFAENVSKIKDEIKNGEAFQVVLSQRFEMELKSDPLDLYRVLRVQNPSPYMYLFRFENNLAVVGSSPEALVKVNGEDVLVHPIAGTRKRSANTEEDQKIGEELLSDPKERAEHVMLVDLGRNDLGRVCKAGSVEVIEFMKLERYSHVMHIVSTVVGKLKASENAVKALFAVFPAGTLSGAPKPSALKIIESLEPVRRGIYGGTIGYIDFNGNLDTCIAIRTAVIKDGKAYVQAGAGVVADSIPTSENEECLNKAAAVLGAISAANMMASK